MNDRGAIRCQDACVHRDRWTGCGDGPASTGDQGRAHGAGDVCQADVFSLPGSCERAVLHRLAAAAGADSYEIQRMRPWTESQCDAYVL